MSSATLINDILRHVVRIAPAHHVLVGDWIALDGQRAALAGVVDGGAREGPTDSPLAAAHAGEEAGHGPDAVVGVPRGATLALAAPTVSSNGW
jgi:hypothetical protein